MKSVRLWNVRVFIGVLLICEWMSLSLAQDREVDINAFVSETQMMSQELDKAILIWWIPEEYWQITLEADPNMTAAQTEEFIKFLRPYMTIVAIDGKSPGSRLKYSLFIN